MPLGLSIQYTVIVSGWDWNPKGGRMGGYGGDGGRGGIGGFEGSVLFIGMKDSPKFSVSRQRGISIFIYIEYKLSKY